ncbi:uncharacterized protein BKA78DRAFT_159111 [Phyllosticta capitalensis]|uniref:uncharacterized protein n=1 Tax=Phyllosticta capitalensis TaxID=121624 RepID=UPI003132955E
MKGWASAARLGSRAMSSVAPIKLSSKCLKPSRGGKTRELVEEGQPPSYQSHGKMLDEEGRAARQARRELRSRNYGASICKPGTDPGASVLGPTVARNFHAPPCRQPREADRKRAVLGNVDIGPRRRRSYIPRDGQRFLQSMATQSSQGATGNVSSSSRLRLWLGDPDSHMR